MIGNLARGSEQTEYVRVYPPTVVGRSEPGSQSTLNFWGVTLDPPPDRHVDGVQAPLGQQLLHITIGKRKAQIPADRKKRANVWSERI